MESKNLKEYTISKEEILKKLKIKGEWIMSADDGENFQIIVEEENE